MSPARPRGPYAKTAARRADIIRAARDGFAERGFAQSSLRDIAERAGITHTGLLHHFRTKDELLAELMRLWAELTVAASRPDHLAHTYFVDRYERARARTARMMSERLPSGRPAEGETDPDTAAMIFHAVLYGLQVQWLLNPRLDIGEAFEHCLHLLLPARSASTAHSPPPPSVPDA